MSFNQRNDFHFSSNEVENPKITNSSKFNTHLHSHSNSISSTHTANHIETQREKELFDILNASKPQPLKQMNVVLPNTNITEEDVAFLKAASEVVKMHENHVDPTIKDILNRLQYSNSPHGGLPISMQYLKSIDQEVTTDDTPLSHESHSVSTISMEPHTQNYLFNNHNNNTMNTPVTTPLGQGVNQQHINTHIDISGGYTHFGQGKLLTGHDESPNHLLIPPFTENPLRNPPPNLGFPQFSLDIFKNNDDSIYHQGSELIHQSRHVDHDVEMGGINTENGDYGEDRNKDGGDSSDEENDEGSESDRRRDSESLNDGSNIDGIPRNFKCADCSISFKRSSDLKRHEKIHLKTPPNVCPKCHKGFARRDALKRHVGTLTCDRNRLRLLEQMKEKGDPAPA